MILSLLKAGSTLSVSLPNIFGTSFGFYFTVQSKYVRKLATEAPTIASAISLIRSQPNLYIIAAIHGRRYLLAEKDLLTVPRMRDVNVGDTIALTDIHEVGSRDYTLRGENVAEAGLKVHATVVEHTKGAMEYIHKKKRRKGYERTIEHKQPYTRLRIGRFDFTDTV
jgi:large subunit ribosomal protein L21